MKMKKTFFFYNFEWRIIWVFEVIYKEGIWVWNWLLLFIIIIIVWKREESGGRNMGFNGLFTMLLIWTIINSWLEKNRCMKKEMICILCSHIFVVLLSILFSIYNVK